MCECPYFKPAAKKSAWTHDKDSGDGVRILTPRWSLTVWQDDDGWRWGGPLTLRNLAKSRKEAEAKAEAATLAEARAIVAALTGDRP